jgi:protein-S-isoprenylcysteine O-methyltransferase Ste14
MLINPLITSYLRMRRIGGFSGRDRLHLFLPWCAVIRMLDGDTMQRYVGALTIVALLGMVWARVLLMRRTGIKAMNFGKIDKTDFLIPPFALFYFYIVFAAAFNFQSVSSQELFHSGVVSWVGVFICLAGLFLMILSLVSFGKSFRVGIDQDHPYNLVTTGIFAFSRNPIYVAFGFVLLGEFLLFSNWILFAYIFVAAWLFHRQISREEEFLKKQYGQQYSEYCHRVRRYL